MVKGNQMKPFRTNKKDRETFAKVLGWTSTTRAIYSNDKTEIFRGINVNMGGDETWQFCNNGYQRTMARLHELFPNNEAEVQLWPNHCIIRVWGDFCHEGSHYGYSTNTGEALFRAVVAMGEAQK